MSDSSTIRLEMPADAGLLPVLCRAVRAFASHYGMVERECARLELALDEVCSNVIVHAYRRDPSLRFEVSAEHTAANEIVIRVMDRGVAFEPSRIPVPDTCCMLQDRQIGGLGIFLARKATDALSFDRLPDGRNCVTMMKRILPEAEAAQA